MLKKVFYYGFIVLVLSSATSCTKSSSSTTTTVGNWVRTSDFEGVARSEAVVAVTSDDKVYVGLGYDGTNRLSDFWKYDVDNDFYVKAAPFPGRTRNSSVSFSANGKVYIGLGYDGEDYLNDFWQYDPSADKWKQLGDFPGSARYGSVAFAINNSGYVCSGYDGNFLKDFWKYDPGTDTWTQKVSPGGSKRNDAVAFVIDQKAYLCTGVNNGTNVDDVWEYDATADKWTEKRRITNVSADSYDDTYTTLVRSNAVGFTLNGKGYITTGINGSYISSTWEYDPATDQWTEKTAYEGTGREGATGFSVKNRAFIGLGRSSSLRFDDMREFKPADTYNAND